jgi:hypothetical protein
VQANDHHGPYLRIRTATVLSKEESWSGNCRSAAIQAEDIHTRAFMQQMKKDKFSLSESLMITKAP